MKITKSQLKQIIKEELIESGGFSGNFGGVASSLGAAAGRNEPPMEDNPDSEIQRKAAEFFTNLEITEKVVAVLVNNIAIPDLIIVMEKIPKIDTAEQEDVLA
jgi:hypothetical protein